MRALASGLGPGLIHFVLDLGVGSPTEFPVFSPVSRSVAEMLERVADAAHKLVATGLLLGAVGGFSFCMMGCYDLVSKARLHRRLKEEAMMKTAEEVKPR